MGITLIREVTINPAATWQMTLADLLPAYARGSAPMRSGEFSAKDADYLAVESTACLHASGLPSVDQRPEVPVRPDRQDTSRVSAVVNLNLFGPVTPKKMFVIPTLTFCCACASTQGVRTQSTSSATVNVLVMCSPPSTIH